MDDVQDILKRLALVERQAAHIPRRGIVKTVQTGDSSNPTKYVLDWGPKTTGDTTPASGGGDGQSSDDPWLSPMITPAEHNGFSSHHTPFIVGQNVMSISMDPEHLTAVIIPADPSNLNPPNGSASEDSVTHRIRKDPAMMSLSERRRRAAKRGIVFRDVDPGTGTPQARHDDDEDVQFMHSYNNHSMQWGSKLSQMMDREAGTVTHSADQSSHELGTGSIKSKAASHEVSDANGGDNATHSIKGTGSVSKDHSVGGNSTVGGNQTVSGNQGVGGNMGVGGVLSALSGLLMSFSSAGSDGSAQPAQPTDVADAIGQTPPWGKLVPDDAPGDDPNAAELQITSRGRTPVQVWSGFFTSLLLEIIPPTDANGPIVNHLGITATETKGAPVIEAIGTDANISIEIKPKGKATVVVDIPSIASYDVDNQGLQSTLIAAGVPLNGLYTIDQGGAVSIRVN